MDSNNKYSRRYYFLANMFQFKEGHDKTFEGGNGHLQPLSEV